MKVFFDTEFTSLIEPSALISIGLVAEDGREFYRELSDVWTIPMCSQFVLSVVLPLLDQGDRMIPEAQVVTELKAWIEGLGEEEVVFISDCPAVDWFYAKALFDKYVWPKNLHKAEPIFFKNSNFQRRYEAALADYWRVNHERQHHALTDALSLKYAWLKANERRY